MNKKNIIFKYNKNTKKGSLSVNGRKTNINVHNRKSSSGTGGYGIHLI